MKFNIESIRENAVRILMERNIEGSEFIVDSMLASDISGVSTHGIKMLPAYIEKFDRGEFSTGGVEINKQTAAFSSVDAKNSIGAVSAMICVDVAISKAKESGIHTVFSKNSNTFGPAFYYVEKIAKAKMIGFICCNSPAAMPANNGLEVMLGTNPFAFACPSKTQGTILLDMATSVVAKSKFLQAKNKGEKLPEGWALDSAGNPTTDPIEAIKGFVMPMAGAKGYGIALMIDVLSGMLSGASYLNKVGKFYSSNGKPMNVGQMFVAIDPAQVYDGDFLTDMDIYIETIRASKAIKGKKVSIPGDRKYCERVQAEEQGISIDEETVYKLEVLFDKCLERENYHGETCC